MADLIPVPDFRRPAMASPRDQMVGQDEFGRQIMQTIDGVRYLGTDFAPEPQQGGRDRGMLRNLLDNIIGFDDEVVTPGERLGAGVEQFAGGLLSDPLGTGAGILQGGYETIERAMAPGATPMDVLGAAGIAMGGGGIFAIPRGALGANALSRVDDYAGSHRAPSREYGASFDDPREMFGGDDIYTQRAANYFGHGDSAMDMEAIRAINAAKNNPDAEVTIYRAVPRDLENVQINAGDWVSPSRRYAQLHGEGPLGGDYQIVEQRVRAGDLFTDGDIHEWGYSPELSANRSTTTGLLASAASDTPAKQVARLLREGRADEVTDDLMAQADPQEMFRLYEAGETGADMPMDVASRMARAREMGRDTPAYHSTDTNISAVDNDRLIGGQFWSTDDVDAINRGEVGAAGRGVVLPLQIRQQNPAGWRQYDQLGVDELMGRGYDGLRLPESDGTNTFVTFDPEQVRSRFARFDPRLSHLSNLNAANVDPLTGAVAVSASQQDDPLANLKAYIAAAGGVLPR